MPIRFKCPTCGRTLSIARRKAGSQVKCPRCEDDVTVPDATDPGDEEINVEPADEPEPVAAARAKPDRLFEESDFESLLDKKVKKAIDDPAPRPAPRPVSAPTPVPELPDQGFTVSRGAAVVLVVLMLVLLGLAFATGYLIGR